MVLSLNLYTVSKTDKDAIEMTYVNTPNIALVVSAIKIQQINTSK